MIQKTHALLTQVFCEYKRNARVRGIEWALTIEEFAAITVLPCHYCGRPPKKIKRRRWYEGTVSVATSKEKIGGVDRVNPAKAYAIENCVPACKRCNQGKNDLSAKKYIEHCQRVAAFNKKPA